ncbi:hypothetical protein RS030_192811 [Cryptosporidium xiaoi]|uniref:Serine/threonine-protein kinase RIO2 n=1 Tax=Cryptosporidium xiaoi TaxID=659607 RepID=A0AAV9Y0I1_9CRYT
MKLDVSNMKFISKDEWRILTAVEMGMRNHEYVSPQLIESIGNLRRTGTYQLLQNLLRNKLVSRVSNKYEGYKLSYLGYDFLALRALSKRGVISSVGTRIGVGKESDIHIGADESGKLVCLKLHRLGRISFRNVKNTRDYLINRKASSWLYLSRLAALKEFSCMKALYENGFDHGEVKVPEPVDWNRHAIVMELIDAVPLNSVRELEDPYGVLEKLMRMIARLADCGLIHGDFNEFNLLIDNKENITLIDFPQIINTNHINAETYFTRDVNCIIDLFRKRFGIQVTDFPKFEDIIIDQNTSNSAVINIEGIDKDMNKLNYLNQVIKDKVDIQTEEVNNNEEDEDGECREYDCEDDYRDEENDGRSTTSDSQEECDNQERARIINERMNNIWLPKRNKIDKSKIKKYVVSNYQKHQNANRNSGSKKSREYRRTKAMIENIKNDY